MENKFQVETVAEMVAAGREPDILFWVGCAGSYDARAQKVTVSLAKILNKAGLSWAILGEEESCCGDPARRAGNEFVFQMTALQNIEILNGYNIKKIVTACPHGYNTLKNEYPALGGNYEVVHHTELIADLLKDGKIKIEKGKFEGKSITYHDSCYLGRVNNVYEVPRTILELLDINIVEMEDSKSKGMCCGAGGAQMFKEDEPGDNRINEVRAEQVLKTGSDIVAANCPFCLTMLSDGLKAKEKQDEVMVYDLSEMIVESIVVD